MNKEKVEQVLSVIDKLSDLQKEYEKLTGTKFEVLQDIVLMSSYIQGYLAACTQFEPKKDVTLEVQ